MNQIHDIKRPPTTTFYERSITKPIQPTRGNVQAQIGYTLYHPQNNLVKFLIPHKTNTEEKIGI